MTSTFNANDPTASGMVLTFDDEFDSNDVSNTGVASGAVWANHLWYGSPDPSAVSVQNGVLSLASGGTLSSVNSQGQGFAQEYGYFVIDMQVPSGVGTWPAFWLMSLAHMLNASAPAAELDIIEGQGNTPNGYYTTLHSNTGGGGSAGPDQFNPDPNYTGNIAAAPLSSGYVQFGVLWSPNSNVITYYMNGVAVATSTVYGTTDQSSMAVLIDNWLGDIGYGGNEPTGQPTGPLNVDYVRVYQFASQDPTAVAAQAVSPAAGQSSEVALANADGVLPNGETLAQYYAANQSPSGTVVLGTNGSIADSSGNSWSINSSGEIVENGVILQATSGVSELAYVGGTVYQEANSTWYALNEQTGAWTQTSDPISAGTATTTDPTTSASTAPAATTASVSPDGTTVMGTNGDIVTAAGNSFAITVGGQITENGTVIAATNSVVELAYVDGVVYQDATPDGQNLWFSLNEQTGAWTQTSDPLSASGSSSADPTTPANVSSNDTTVIGTNGDIVSAAGHAYAIDAAGQVTQDGNVLAVTHNVVELAYVDGTVYQDATPDGQNLWFSLNEQTGAWTQTSDPLSSTSSTTADNGSTGSTTSVGSSTATTTAFPTPESVLAPDFTVGDQHIYVVTTATAMPAEITNFNPATDALDLSAYTASVARPGATPTINLEAGPNGSTEVLVDPTGGTHGTDVVQLDHLLPAQVPMSDIWH